VTILTEAKIPIGIRGLYLFLFGVSGVYLLAFFIPMILILSGQGEKYNIDSIDLTHTVSISIISLLVPAIFALTASTSLFYKKSFSRLLIIGYGISAMTGFAWITSGHPLFLFGIMGAIVVFYMWQPNVREYFQSLTRF